METLCPQRSKTSASRPAKSKPQTQNPLTSKGQQKVKRNFVQRQTSSENVSLKYSPTLPCTSVFCCLGTTTERTDIDIAARLNSKLGQQMVVLGGVQPLSHCRDSHLRFLGDVKRAICWISKKSSSDRFLAIGAPPPPKDGRFLPPVVPGILARR